MRDELPAALHLGRSSSRSERRDWPKATVMTKCGGSSWVPGPTRESAYCAKYSLPLEIDADVRLVRRGCGSTDKLKCG
jgi:hypothetical protein